MQINPLSSRSAAIMEVVNSPDTRIGAAEYLSGIWRSRYFWLSLVRMDLRSRYRRSALGIGWSLLQPLAMTCVLCVVFSTMFGVDVRTYGAYLLIGLSFWQFISNCVLQGCRAFQAAEAYIRQMPQPMLIYPLRVVLASGFHFLLSLGLALLMVWILIGFGNLPALPLIVPVLLMVFLLGLALAMIFSVVNVYFPDTQHLSEVGLSMAFYLTPVIYTKELLTQRKMDWLIDINPLANALELLRAPILYGDLPSLWRLGMASGTIGLVCLIAYALFFSRQRTLIFRL